MSLSKPKHVKTLGVFTPTGLAGICLTAKKHSETIRNPIRVIPNHLAPLRGFRSKYRLKAKGRSGQICDAGTGFFRLMSSKLLRKQRYDWIHWHFFSNAGRCSEKSGTMQPMVWQCLAEVRRTWDMEWWICCFCAALLSYAMNLKMKGYMQVWFCCTVAAEYLDSVLVCFFLAAPMGRFYIMPAKEHLQACVYWLEFIRTSKRPFLLQFVCDIDMTTKQKFSHEHAGTD